MPRIRFGRLIIIESIPSGQAPTGKQLFDALHAVATKTHPGLSVEYAFVGSRTDFEGTLKKIWTETVATRKIPLLHFEAHGSDEGLELANGEFEYWDELGELLSAINEASGFDLFVSVSACMGAYLNTRLSPTRPAPFSACLSVSKTQFPDELYRGFDAFYRTLMSTGQGDDALTALKAQNKGGASFFIGEASHFFHLACRKYFEQYCTQEKYRERIERILAEATEKGKPTKSHDEIRQFFLSSERPYFEKFRQTYFMLDRFPDNALRFPIEFEDVRR